MGHPREEMPCLRDALWLLILGVQDSIPLAIDESAECQCWRTSIAVIPMKGLVSWGRR